MNEDNLKDQIRAYLSLRKECRPVDTSELSKDLRYLSRMMPGDRYIWFICPGLTRLVAINKFWNYKDCIDRVKDLDGYQNPVFFEVCIRDTRRDTVYGKLTELTLDEALERFERMVYVFETPIGYHVVTRGELYEISTLRGKLGEITHKGSADRYIPRQPRMRAKSIPEEVKIQIRSIMVLDKEAA